MYGYECTRTLNFICLDSTDGLSEELYYGEEIYFFQSMLLEIYSRYRIGTNTRKITVSLFAPET